MPVNRGPLSREEFLGRSLAILGPTLLGGACFVLPRCAPEQETDPYGLDAVQRRAHDDLKVFTDWLAREGARGYVGEVNWPNDQGRGFGDEAQWGALGDEWYRRADAAGLWATLWCVNEYQRWGGFWLTAYVSVGDGETRPISEPMAQAPVYEAHPSTERYRRGINLSGAERWEEGLYTNADRTTHGVDYWYASRQTMDYLSSRGTDLVRLPFRWERVQPKLGGPLEPAELSRLKGCLLRAGEAGLGVILDVHNYAEYWVRGSGGPVSTSLGSSRLPLDAFNDLWRRLSDEFKREPAAVAYDLMNEPHVRGDIPAAGHASPQKAWEIASQGVVETIRGNDDPKLLMVPGYAHVHRWADKHPARWIEDPADNHMYTVHQYFDAYRGPGTGGGQYRYSYRDENAHLRDRGY